MCPSVASTMRWAPSTSSCCTPRVARCVGSRSRPHAATTRPIENARSRAGLWTGGARAGRVDRGPMERTAALVAAIDVARRAGVAARCAAHSRQRAALVAQRGLLRLAVRDRLALRHLLVALHLDAH